MAIADLAEVPLKAESFFTGEDGKTYLRFNEIRVDKTHVMFVFNGTIIMSMKKPPSPAEDELAIWGFDATMECTVMR